MTKRVGKKMLQAAYVCAHPGVSKLQVAQRVGPNGSTMYGYNAVDRAIRAGLIRAEKGKGNSYRLYGRDC